MGYPYTGRVIQTTRNYLGAIFGESRTYHFICVTSVSIEASVSYHAVAYVEHIVPTFFFRKRKVKKKTWTRLQETCFNCLK